MDIQLKDTVTNELINAKILLANFKDMPLKDDGWNFNWRELFKEEGIFYKVVLNEYSGKPEGLIKMTVENKDMLVLNYIEVAPHNYGSSGRYDYVAGCLIAFASNLSFEIGRGHFIGFLVFNSKTKLISLYESKYGATRIGGQRMYIDPKAGRKLMKQYLGIIKE